MTGCKNNLKRISTQNMVTFNNCCNVACLKFKLHVIKQLAMLRTVNFFEGRNASSIRRMNFAFHKVQWQHILGVVDRFKNTYAEFLQDSVYQNYSNRFIFDGVIQKIKMWPLFWDTQ